MFGDMHHDSFSLTSHQPAKYIADPQVSEVHLFVDLENVTHHPRIFDLALFSRSDGYLKFLLRIFQQTNMTEKKRVYRTIP